MADQDNLIEGVEFVDENPVSPHVGIDNEDEDGDGGNVLDKETVDEVVEGDGLKVESSVISTTHEAGDEVGRINDVNDREMFEADESVAEDETQVFMREMVNFYRERGTEFKHPKFYGELLDCLKLWRTVVQLGGYERHDGIADSGEPTTKDMSSGPGLKREKNLKSIGSFKQRKLGSVEQTDGAMVLVERDKQLDASVVDIGPPVDWVKISVRETKDCFEVYALVPGLLREEVRVQSDPAGRVVITGEPEQLENPWGITGFKKILPMVASLVRQV